MQDNNITSKEIIQKLYKQDYSYKAESGEGFEVTKEGSLGLLALGYKGVIAWRKKRMEDRNDKTKLLEK